MRLKSDKEILDPVVRKRIIEETLCSENMTRKDNAYRKYLAYKDRTGELVTEQLYKQFDYDTVREMSYAVSNISFARKIVKKLARVYSSGVIRTVPDDEPATQTIQELEAPLKINEEMKRTNRALRLQHNTMLYVRPCQTDEGYWDIKLECLQPYLYDVVENYFDRTQAMVVVLSDYAVNRQFSAQVNNNMASKHLSQPSNLLPKSDGNDQKIADQDVVTKEFVWWSKNYHFTTDQEGTIISSPNPTAGDTASQVANPIGLLPLVNFAIDQDGKFWSEGGNDLVDGAVTANSMITQIKHIGVTQGYGQFWIKGKNVPSGVKIGPSKYIRLEWNDKEEPEPQIGFESASPNLDGLMNLVELEVALLLTTNNLSTSGVSTSLDGNNSFPSGIAMMIDKSESVEDVQDQEQIFKDEEPEVWNIVARWLDIYGDSLVEDLRGKALPTDDMAVKLKFNQPMHIQTEKERLENLALRRDLGINTMIDLIMQDNPSITKEEAEAKLLEIAEEKAQRMASVMIKPAESEDQEEEKTNDETSEEGQAPEPGTEKEEEAPDESL